MENDTTVYTPKRTDYTLDEIGMPKSTAGGLPFAAQPFVASARANRLFGLPADQIIIEKSIDGGATWTDAGIADSVKQCMFMQRGSGVPMPQINGKNDCNAMLRITITGMKYNVPEGTPETEKYNY